MATNEARALIVKDDRITNANLLDLVDGGETTLHSHAGGAVIASGRRLSAYRSSAQSINATTWTTVLFDTELYDKLGEYDNAANCHFTASVAGYYHITASGVIKFAAAGKVALMDIWYNNTSELATVYFSSASVDAQGTVSKTIYLALNDYIEIRVFHYDSVARNVTGTIMETYFCVDRVEA